MFAILRLLGPFVAPTFWGSPPFVIFEWLRGYALALLLDGFLFTANALAGLRFLSMLPTGLRAMWRMNRKGGFSQHEEFLHLAGCRASPCAAWAMRWPADAWPTSPRPTRRPARTGLATRPPLKPPSRPGVGDAQTLNPGNALHSDAPSRLDGHNCRGGCLLGQHRPSYGCAPAQRNPLMLISAAMQTPVVRQSATAAMNTDCTKSRSTGRRVRVGGTGRGARVDFMTAEAQAVEKKRQTL
jgi:hypothetical protein